MTRTRGQKNIVNGVCTRMDHLINRRGGGAVVVLLSPERDVVECMIRLDFPTTNNEAEYEALVASLDLARAAGATNVVIYYDSQVITNQINGDYKCKGERMKLYLKLYKKKG